MPCENPIAVHIVPVLMMQGFHFGESSLSIDLTKFDANSSMNIPPLLVLLVAFGVSVRQLGGFIFLIFFLR